jgi:hypothetical protein
MLMTSPHNLCIYTVLIGDYESLNEQPTALSSDVPYICLTDNPSLTSRSWTIVQVPTAFPMDPIRSQRILKTCPHSVPALAGFDHSLYIDNSVVLRVPPEQFVGTLAMDSGMGLPTHSFRHSVHDEFIEVARLGFDDQGRIFEQLNHYLASEDAALEERPHWTAILLRDHRNARVRHAMELWASHILRYSRRDQLSFNTVVRMAGLTPDRWEMDNLESFFHKWPHAPGRERFAGTRNPLTSVMPLPTQLAQTRSEMAQMRGELDVLQRESDGFLEGIAARSRLLDEARQAVDHESQRSRALQEAAAGHVRHLEQLLAVSTERTLAQEQLLAEAHERDLARAQELERVQDDARSTLAAFHASTSWRVTAPLRRIRRWLG